MCDKFLLTAIFIIGLGMGLIVPYIYDVGITAAMPQITIPQEHCKYGDSSLEFNGTPAPWCDYDSNGWHFNEDAWRRCHVR